MEHPLERMDCFDISHTQGSETVASMVVFRNGTSSKKITADIKLSRQKASLMISNPCRRLSTAVTEIMRTCQA